MTPAVRYTPPLTEADQAIAPGAPGLCLRLGTRASALATAQATWVADQLRGNGHHVELVPVRTDGDASTAPLTEIGGTGVFAAALRQALLDDHIDLAVHSLKDLPVAPVTGLVVAAVPPREDCQDALISRSGALADLGSGAVVGTGSPRRAAQLRLLSDDIEVRDIRGNIDTRIGMVDSGDLDAVVLAAAGLRRLGRTDRISQQFDFEQMLPAPGQGALAVECRSDDVAIVAALEVLEDATTRQCVTAERQLLARLEAGCTAPVAAWCPPPDVDGTWTLTAFAAFDQPRRRRASGPDPLALADQLSAALLHSTGSPDHPDPISPTPTAPAMGGTQERES